jgi:hypothetical protein
MTNAIYLDGFATLPLAPEAREAMLAAWTVIETPLIQTRAVESGDVLATVPALYGQEGTGTPIDLLEIGPPLIFEKGFTTNEMMNALKMLQSERVIDLIEGNRLVLL